MVLTIVKVVVAVIVVAVPVVVDAVHDNHPLLLDPFPRMERADMPQRNGRPCPVARMAREVMTGEMARRRMVAGLRTELAMPCGGRLIDMVDRSGMRHRVRFCCRSRDVRSPHLLGSSSRPADAALGSPRLLGSSSRPSDAAAGSPRLLGRACRAAVAAGAAAFRRCECRCAECRAGKPDECDFHEVVVHSTPSLSVCDLTGSSSRPYVKQGGLVTRF